MNQKTVGNYLAQLSFHAGRLDRHGTEEESSKAPLFSSTAAAAPSELCGTAEADF